MGVFHRGEIEVQTRAGVRDMAARVGRGIRDTIPAPAADFLRGLPFVVAGGVDGEGRVWASILAGEPGFVRALDERHVEIRAGFAPGDPLGAELRPGAPLGLLAIEPETRRRMRLNGLVDAVEPGRLLVAAREVFANCPKYIQARHWDRLDDGSPPPPSASSSDRLSAEQARAIGRADTFFVATHARSGGADVSHRGGAPGFVRVEGPSDLVWPDYQGNMMFQTLGNLVENPRAGLVFVDFERGTALQLAGEARIDWDEAAAADFPGAERLVRFRVERVVEIERALPLRWRFLDASPFNPSA